MIESPENYYQILGIGEDADDDVVKQAFRELAKHYHPDHNPGNAEAEVQFKRVSTAYEGLKDSSRRQAYNEWLAFADRREKAKRTQWGRLAAMVGLLLLGPTAVLYWIIFIEDISVFDSARDRPSAVSISGQDRLPDAPAAGKAVTPEKKPGQGNGAPEKSKQAVVDPPPKPQNPPVQATKQTTPPPVEPVAAPAVPPSIAVAPSTEAQTTSGGNVAARDSAPKPSPTTPTVPDFTQSLPDNASETGSLSPAELAKLEAEARKRDPAVMSGSRESQAGGARETARMLARLKEPDGAMPEAPASAEARPALPALKKPLPLGASEGGSDAFTDCPMCPMMSITRRSSSEGAAPSLAVSQSVITVAQWNACVEDDACPPHRSGANKDGEISNISQRDARAYTEWLSRLTGHPYSAVMPLTPREARREAAASDDRDCNPPGRRRDSGGFQWLEDGGDRDCQPSASSGKRGSSARGFRVARTVQSSD